MDKLGVSGPPPFNAQDANSLAVSSHPDMISPAPSPTGRGERGSQGDRECNESWFAGFPDARIRLTHQVMVGNHIVQEGSFDGANTGTFRTAAGDIAATGRRLKGQFAQVSTMSNGVIVSTRLYFDQVEP